MKTTHFLGFFTILFSMLCATNLYAIKFEFKYTTGHTYDIISIVEQEVFINDIKSHDALITNRIHVKEVEAQADGSGKIDTTYKTTEVATFVHDGSEQALSQTYYSSLSRDKLGDYILDENAYMPVIRNVPIFPDRDLQPGDAWTGQGEEVHDFRQNFGIVEPFRIPFIADYMYRGTENVGGKDFHVITVSYDLIYESPFPVRDDQNFPILTIMNSNQTLYWDTNKGYLDHYKEDYHIMIETNWGDVITFTGDAHAEVINFKDRPKDETLDDVKSKIDNLALENVSAHIAPEGITISLEDIQFEAESAVLQPSAIEKLRHIADILKTLPENDLLITGHTALAGTVRGRQILSEERAESVAIFLIELGVRNSNQVKTQGMGSDDPVAPNDTNANKAKNRRVEITILNK